MLLLGSKSFKLTAIISLLLHAALIGVFSPPDRDSVPQRDSAPITLSEIVAVEKMKSAFSRPIRPSLIPTSAGASDPQANSTIASLDKSAGADDETSHHSTAGQMDPYIAEVIHAINHVKKYPDASMENEEQGVVLLLVAVERSGQIQVLEILKGSGFPRLDESARASVNQIQHFEPLPDRFQAPLLLRIPIRYSIWY